jgi:ketosteroid isomerase-like protein
MTTTTSDLAPETEALADRFVRSIEAGDVAGVGSCFGDGAVVWHNDDGITVPARKVLRVLGWLAAHVSDLRYDVSRRLTVTDGYVQQHVLRGIAPDGSELALAACLIVRVEDGHITRIDEYLDSAATGALRG